VARCGDLRLGGASVCILVVVPTIARTLRGDVTNASLSCRYYILVLSVDKLCGHAHVLTEQFCELDDDVALDGEFLSVIVLTR